MKAVKKIILRFALFLAITCATLNPGNASAISLSDVKLTGGAGLWEEIALIDDSLRRWDFFVGATIKHVALSFYGGFKGFCKLYIFDIAGHINLNPSGYFQPFFNSGISIGSTDSDCENSDQFALVFDVGLRLEYSRFHIQILHKSRLSVFGDEIGTRNATFFGAGVRL